MKLELEWPKSVPKNQFSQEFLQGMLNRVAVGYLRYGENSAKRTSKNAVQKLSVDARVYRVLSKYLKTGNTEFLMDVANYAMLEFMDPVHKEAHFSPSDSDPTPSITAFFHVKGEQ